MSKRTDIHRVGAIVPEDYELILSYNLATSQDNWPVPSFGINCELDRRVIGPNGEAISNGEHNANGLCCVVGMIHVAKVKFADHGCAGSCTICGAHFVYGDVWRHKDGEHIHIGHTCAAKYEMVVERGDFDARYESFKARTAAHRIAESNRSEREAFLAEHAGLEDALKTDHHIVQDIAARFRSQRFLSEPQIALVMKLAHEAANPPPAEVNVPAPEGRVLVRGVIVSAKGDDGAYGPQYRMTVKVATPDGSWLAWGTIPQSIFDDANEKIQNEQGYLRHLRGCEVEFTATLKRGRDAHFALFKRPTKARIVTVPPGSAKKPREVESDTPDPFAEFEPKAA